MFTDSNASHHLCPRLLDYVVIVGSREPGSRRDIKTPELLRRYPPDDHADFILPNDIVFFCQPEGCYTIGQRCSASARKCVNFTFTLTDKDANKVRYGICSNFYRTAERSDTSTSLSSVDGGGVLPTKAKKKKLFTLTSICIVSHHAFFTTFRQIIHTLQQMINACQQRVRHLLRPRQKLLGARLANQPLWTILSGQITPAAENSSTATAATAAAATPHYHQSQNNQVMHLILHEIKQLETWMLTLLSAPVPIPEHTRVELELLPPPSTAVQRNAYEAVLPRLSNGASSWQPIVFALPDKTRLPLVDMPVHFPLELMGIETCLRVLAVILLENKVVFQSRDFCALSQTVMSFVALLYPLEYMFPIIPLLPSCMAETEHLMLAPTPYIIGIPASFFLYKKDFVLPDDVWLVDIDASRIVPPEATMREERLRQQHLASLNSSNHNFQQNSSPTPSATLLTANNANRSNTGSNSSSRNFSPVPPRQQLSAANNNLVNPALSTIWPLSELPDNAQLVRELRYALTLLAIVDNEPQTQQFIQNYQHLKPHERQQLIDYIRRRTYGVENEHYFAVEGEDVLNIILDAGICADADALDVYIRSALVRYFLSDNLLADLTEHCRVMRLFPRPVVAFQLYSFIKSRPQRTAFVDRLAKTQAIEYFAEWVLSPTNLAFQRITTGVNDARAVGDKAKWFQDSLEPVQFVVYDKKTTLHQALVEYASHQSIGSYSSVSPNSQQQMKSISMGADEGDSPNDDEELASYAANYGAQSEANKQSSVDNELSAGGESDDEEVGSAGKTGESTTTSSSYSSINEFVSDVVRRRAQRKQQQQNRQSNLVQENRQQFPGVAGASQQQHVPQTAEEQENYDDEYDDAVCHGNARIKPQTQKLPLCSSELDSTKLCQPPKTLRDAAGAHAVPSPSSSITSLFSAAGGGAGDDDDEHQNKKKSSKSDKNRQDDDDDDSPSSGDDRRSTTSSQRQRRKRGQRASGKSAQQTSRESSVTPLPTEQIVAAKPAPPPRPPAPVQQSLSISRDPSLDSSTAEQRGSTRQASITSLSSAQTAAQVAAASAVQHTSTSPFQRTDSGSELVDALAPLKLRNQVHDIADKSRLKASRLLYKLRESSKEFMHDLPSKMEKKVEQFEQKFDKFADAAITRPDALIHNQQQQQQQQQQHRDSVPIAQPQPPQQQIPQSTALQSPLSEVSDVTVHRDSNATPPPTTNKPLFDLKSHMKKIVSDPKTQFAELRTAMDARIDQFNKEGRAQTQTLLRKAVDEATKIAGGHHFNNSSQDESTSNFHRHDSIGSAGAGAGAPNIFTTPPNATQHTAYTGAARTSSPAVTTTFATSGGTVDVGMATSADQIFLRDIADGVTVGDGISWLKMSKLKELMKDETNRWLVVQCISHRAASNTQQRLYRDDEFIEDVQLSKEQFKGLKKLCEALIAGYEHTFNMWGLGGMGSVFGLLEIAYTHYYEKPLSSAAQQQQQYMQMPAQSDMRRNSSASTIGAETSASLTTTTTNTGENRLEDISTGMKSVFRSTNSFMKNLRSQLGATNSPSFVNNLSSGGLQQMPAVNEPHPLAQDAVSNDKHTLSGNYTHSPTIRLLSKSPSPKISVDNTGEQSAVILAKHSSPPELRRSTSGDHSSPATSGPDDAGTETSTGAATTTSSSNAIIAPVVLERSTSSPIPPVIAASDSSVQASQHQLGHTQPVHYQQPHNVIGASKPINTVLGPAFQEAPSPYWSSPASSQPGSRRSSRTSFVPAGSRPSVSSLANVNTTSHSGFPSHSQSQILQQPGMTDVDSPENANSIIRRKKLIAHHTIHSQSVESAAADSNEQQKLSNSRKSSITSGTRYQAGSIVPTTDYNQALAGGKNDLVQFLPERVYLFELLAGGIAGNTYSWSPLGFSALKRSKIWDQLQFWEDAFIDATAHERDLVGLGDADPSELLQRYSALRQADRKQMENDEDKVLAIMMYNLCAFMVSMRVNKAQLRRKLQRLLGKSHLGLLYNPQINQLLDTVVNLHGNDIDLKPPLSRQQRSQTYAVYLIPHADPLTTTATNTTTSTPVTTTASTLTAKSSKTPAPAGRAEFAIDANHLIEQSRAFQEASRTAAQHAAAAGGALGTDAGTQISKATLNKNLMFMEVRDDGLLLKSMHGVPVQRCPYENLINMTFSPRTRVLCLWTRSDAQNNINSQASATTGGGSLSDGERSITPKALSSNPSASTPGSAQYRKPVLNNQTMLSKFYCRQCKELYTSIKTELGHAAVKAGGGNNTAAGAGVGGRSATDMKQGAGAKHDPAATWTGELGGDFPVQDQQTGEGGLLKVTMDGISLLFAESKAFVELARIRKCFTQEGGVFVLEEFDPATREISQRSFKSPMADQICYAVLCLFSYIAAGKDNSTVASGNVPSTTQQATT